MDSKTNKELLKINSQLIALIIILGTVAATIYVTWGFRDILINGENSQFDEDELNDITENTALIFFIVAIYFFILAYDNYKNEDSQANTSYLTAATLALTASGIRYYQLKANPENFEGAEDIVA